MPKSNKKKKSSAHPDVTAAKTKKPAIPQRGMAARKNGKVKDTILSFLPVGDLPLPTLPEVPTITNVVIYNRVYGGWSIADGSPKHPMELAGDRTLDLMIVLGIDRRCPELPIYLGNQLKTILGTNTFLAVLCKRLNLTKGLFGDAVKASYGFGTNPGVMCGHFEVFLMGLYESNGTAAVYKFLWAIFEAYGPFLFDRMVAHYRKRHYAVKQLNKWKASLFAPTTKDDSPDNDYTRLGPWLMDALRLHGQELQRPFELLEQERSISDTTARECAVIQDTMAIAVAQAATAAEAKQMAVSEALAKLDFLDSHAVNLLYEYAAQTDIELEFSVGNKGCLYTACVHWGNGDDSKVIGRALRASSIESQSAAAVIAVRNLNLSLTEYSRTGKVQVIGAPTEDNENDDYAIDIGPMGPVIVIE